MGFVNTVNKMKIALIQMSVGASKSENLLKACKKITEAANEGAKLVSLPECFNSPYGIQYFRKYAEKIPGESSKSLADAARKNKIYLIGGSIPEEDNGKFYNTCVVFNPDGEILLKHRKVHLFDIDIPGKIKFQESEVLTAGSSLSMFETPECKVGVGICYDIRFAEMAQVYAREGCKLLIYPGAFNMTTGPAHWELLQKCRAVDNQLYCASVSPARDESASYIAWGHTSLTDPWGKVVASADHMEQTVTADIDLDYVKELRMSIPLTSQRRNDIYQLKYNLENKKE